MDKHRTHTVSCLTASTLIMSTTVSATQSRQQWALTKTRRIYPTLSGNRILRHLLVIFSGLLSSSGSSSRWRAPVVRHRAGVN